METNELPYITDDILYKIFVKCHPKTVCRLRCVNKHWSLRLLGKEFVEENWRENERRDESVIIGYGYSSTGDRSHWGVGVHAGDGSEIPLRLPLELVEYRYFTIIGSDNGNLCVRFSSNGELFGLIVYNPTTAKFQEIEDQAFKYWNYSVSVYAFGYLQGSWEYWGLYLCKSSYEDLAIHWIMWNSVAREWVTQGEYHTQINKIGPTSVVIEGVVYWIGWGGFFSIFPTHLIAFNLENANFFEEGIPAENTRSFHSIHKFHNSLAFISYEDMGLDREVHVWSVSRTGGDKFVWEKIIHINSFGIPYCPNILVGYDFLSILDIKSTSSGSNDDQRMRLSFLGGAILVVTDL